MSTGDEERKRPDLQCVCPVGSTEKPMQEKIAWILPKRDAAEAVHSAFTTSPCSKPCPLLWTTHSKNPPLGIEGGWCESGETRLMHPVRWRCVDYCTIDQIVLEGTTCKWKCVRELVAIFCSPSHVDASAYPQGRMNPGETSSIQGNRVVLCHRHGSSSGRFSHCNCGWLVWSDP